MSKSYPVDQGTDWMKDTTPPCRCQSTQPSRVDPTHRHPRTRVVDLSSGVGMPHNQAGSVLPKSIGARTLNAVIVDLSSPGFNVARSSEVRPQRHFHDPQYPRG